MDTATPQQQRQGPPALDSLPAYALKVVQALAGGADGKPAAQERDGWLFHCPCPGHAGGKGYDRNPSVRLTAGEEGRLLLICRTGCSRDDVLQAAGLTYRDLFPGAGDVPLEPLCLEPIELTQADAELRDAVYSALLGKLKLSPKHKADLLRRGLDEGAIPSGGYKSLERSRKAKAARDLYSEFGNDLFGVPGFKPSAKTAVFSTPLEGLLVPCRDERGQVVALKVRRDTEESPRYVYVSGREEGLSCGAHVHHPVRHGDELDDYVLVTEGELKADVCQHLGRRRVLGLPGVALWRSALHALGSGEAQVRLGFDWPDVRTKHGVFTALRDCLTDLRGAGFQVSVETWDHALEHKGLDDLLASGGVPLTLSDPEQIDKLLSGIAKSFAAPLPASGVHQGTPDHDADPFPLDVFPPAVADFVRAVAACKQGPEDYPGVGCLVVASAMVGASRALRIKGGWTEKPCLYSMIVADAGSRKSPALKLVMSPVYRLQEEVVAKLSGPDEMLKEHLFVNDITTEAIARVLRDNFRGVLAFRDEASALVRSHDQYRGGKGTDRQFWLSAWSSEPLKVDRKAGGTIHVAHPLLCFLGGIQPSMCSELEDKKGREDGFLHRILFSYPASQTWPGWSDAALEDDVAQEWHGAVLRLRALEPFPGDKEAGLGMAPKLVEMTPQAKAEWVAWYDAHEAQMRDEKVFDRKLTGHWSKLEAYCARFALVLRMMWTEHIDSTEPVNELDVRRAVRLVDYFKSHAKLVYAQLKSAPEDPAVARLVELASSAPEGSIATRDAMRRLKLGTKSEVLAVFKRAADRGLGEVLKVKDPVTGRPKDVFSVRSVEE